MTVSNPSGDSTITGLPAAQVLLGSEFFVIDQLQAGLPATVKLPIAQLAAQLFNPSGSLQPNSGGTGRISLTAHAVLLGEGTSPVNFAAPGTAGQMLLSAGAALDPLFGNNPVITGGTIDGAPIGGITPSTGAFTTLSSTGLASLNSLALTTALSVPNGGTGRTTLTSHGVLVGEGIAAINQTVAGTTGQMLLGVTGADPAFGNNPTITGGTVDGAVIGGTMPAAGTFTTVTASTAIAVPSGGTGRATLTTHGVLLGEGTAAINQTAVGTTGQMLLGVTGADPAFGNNPTITAGTIDGAVIGGTTAAAGSFTTITASSTITPSQTSGIVGTTTNNNVNAGSVGEFVSATSGSVSLTSGTNANVITISLTAGDWDVEGSLLFQPAGTTVVTNILGGSSTTSATLPAIPGYAQIQNQGTGGNCGFAVPKARVSIASTTTVYLVALSTFTTSTMTAVGNLNARRVR